MDEFEVAATQRTVRGGATAFPRENPRPAPLEFWPLLCNSIKEGIRGPLYAAIFTKLTFPTFVRVARTRFGSNEQALFTWSISLVHNGLFLVFAVLEMLKRTKWLEHYLLPRKPAQEPTWKMQAKVVLEFALNGLLNHFIVAPKLYSVYTKHMPSAYAELPPVWKLWLHFSFCSNFNQVCVAVLHRLLHHGPLYRAIHKKHHEFVGTVGIAAENAHPIEHVLHNVLPTLGGCYLVSAHPYVFFVWLAWRLELAFEVHSGYCFYDSWAHKLGFTHAESCAMHDFHHTDNKGAFATEMIDHLFGTMDSWILMGRMEGYIQRAREQRAKQDL